MPRRCKTCGHPGPTWVYCSPACFTLRSSIWSLKRIVGGKNVHGGKGRIDPELVRQRQRELKRQQRLTNKGGRGIMQHGG